MDHVLFGKRVRSLRRILEMTQERLAKETGLSVSYIGLLERGKRKPSAETVYQLCVAMGAPADHLLGLDN